MSVKSFSFPTAIGADAAAAVGPGALLNAGVDAGLLAEGTGGGGILLPIGVDAGLFMGVTEATLACIEGVIRGVWGAVAGPFGLGTWGGKTFVSFFGGALAGLPVGGAAIAGRVRFLTSLGFGGTFGLGTVATSGDVPPNPIFGNGATGLAACFAGREGPGKPEKGSFGDSNSTAMGAGGATGFGSGGGGWRLALNCLRSRSRTALDRSFSSLAPAWSTISISQQTYQVAF